MNSIRVTKEKERRTESPSLQVLLENLLQRAESFSEEPLLIGFWMGRCRRWLSNPPENSMSWFQCPSNLCFLCCETFVNGEPRSCFRGLAVDSQDKLSQLVDPRETASARASFSLSGPSVFRWGMTDHTSMPSEVKENWLVRKSFTSFFCSNPFGKTSQLTNIFEIRL